MTLTLPQFFDELDRHRSRIPLDALRTALSQLSVGPNDLAPFVCFSDEGYQRNLIHRSPAYEALVLCWKNGQRTPIHDHRGSSCGVRVIRGVVTETVFKHRNGWVYASESHDLNEGGVCGSNDMDTHQLSNLQCDGGDLITMHIYSPPLEKMGVYTIEDNRVRVIDSPRNVPVGLGSRVGVLSATDSEPGK